MPNDARPELPDAAHRWVAELAADRSWSQLDGAQRDVWMSGAVAEWADLIGLDDLVAAAESLRAALQPSADDGAALLVGALDRLQAATPTGVDVVGIEQVSGVAAGVITVAFTFAVEDEAAHALLIDVEGLGGAGEVTNLWFGEGTVIDAASSEARAEGMTVERRAIEVAGFATSDIGVALATILAAPVADEGMNRANALAAANRLRCIGLAVAIDVPRYATEAYVPPAPDPEGDKAARELLHSSFGPRTQAPPAVQSIAEELASRLRAGDDDIVGLLTVAGFGADTTEIDPAVLTRLVSAYVHPSDLSLFEPNERRLIDAIEWADWLGAVLPIVRGGHAIPVTPEQLVTNINRCPEVTTTIPKRDRPAMEAAFALVLHAWQLTEAIDDDAMLTEIGGWLLLEGLRAAAGDEPGG